MGQKGFKEIIILGGVLFVGISFFLIFKSNRTTGFLNQVQTTNRPFIKTVLTPSPTSDPTIDWRIYSNSQYKFSFKYPSDWKETSRRESLEGPQSVEIKNQDNTARMVVLFGFNKDTEKALSEFLDIFIQGGAQRLIIDGSNAAKSEITYERIKMTTVYIIAKDKSSLINVSFESKESYLGQEYDKFVNQILSTIKFTN